MSSSSKKPNVLMIETDTSNNYVEMRKELSRRLIKRIEEAEGIKVKIIPKKRAI